MENQCIYYKDRPDLSFETAEHVFPAGLGGMMKLPKGYVSIQFNNDISDVELRFMRESLISLPRQILGPGKRGKSGIKHATKSEIHLIESLQNQGTFSLGYIQLGKPFEIPQIKIDQETGQLLCSIPKGGDSENAQAILIEHLSRFDEKNIRYTLDNQLGEKEFIIGFGKVIHIFKSPTNSFKVDQALSQHLLEAITKIASPQEHQSFHIKTKQDAVLGEDFYRVCAKTAFNALAMLKGKDFVLNSGFDEIRNYIAHGGDKYLVVFNPTINKVIKFPDDAHHVILSSADGCLFANVSFYNHCECQVLLSSDFHGKISAEGFICDWKNKEEIPLMKYFAKEHARNLLKK